MRPVNLLPVKHRPRAAQGALQGSGNLLLGALAALLLATVFYVLTANQANTRKTESAAAAAEAEKAEAEAAQLGSFGNFSKIKATRVASVKLLSATRVDWERVMRELAHVLPARVYLKQLDASASGTPADDSGGGGEGGGGEDSADDPSAAAQGPGIKMTGCSPSQRRVATLLVRLRQLHQVDDVELKESRRDIEEGGAANPAAGAADANGAAGAEGNDDSCAPDYRFEVLVKFKPDTSVKEASEGPEKVPSTLGGGT